MRRTFLTILTFAAIGASAQLNYNIEKYSGITIDGDASDWAAITQTEAFVDHENGAAVSEDTRARIVWDDDNLYIGFQAVDTDIEAIIGPRDKDIFNTDDLVEVFIDPDGDGRNYLEIGVNAQTVFYDYLITCPTSVCGSWSSDANLTLSNFERAAGYSGTLNDDQADQAYWVEMKIPFADLNAITNGGFSTPNPGDTWSANMFRISRTTGTNPLYYSWNPHGSFGYHQPTEFGTWTFQGATAGMDVSEEASLKVYPNPTSGITYISETVQSVKVLDAMGVEVLSLDDVDQIDASSLESGVYSLLINNNGELTSQKLIIE